MFSLRAAAAAWLFAGALIGLGCRLGYDEVADAGHGDASMDGGMPDADAMVDRDATIDMDATVDGDAMVDMDATIGMDAMMDAMPPVEAGQDAGPDAEVGFLASTASLGRAFENNCMVADGALFCWGSNHHWLLGQAPTSEAEDRVVPTPLQITFPAQTWRAVCSGEQHACALDDAGEIYCWGDNPAGVLGVPTSQEALSYSPRRIETIAGSPATGGFTQISCQGLFTCALRPDDAAQSESGLIYCWGSNNEGSLGVEPSVPTPGGLAVPTPIDVDSSLRFKSISAGGGHACALTVAGELYCWGRNSQGQMGDGLVLDDDRTNWQRRSPAQVGSATWLAVSAGLKVTCGVQTDQHLYCWGGRRSQEGVTVNAGATNGEVGNGDPTGDEFAPGDELVPRDIGILSLGGATRTWRTVVTSVRTHECALTTEDELYCWGNGENGQLGDGHHLGDGHAHGTGYSNATATLVESEDGVNDEWEQVGMGGAYTCALRNDHSLWCWGKDEFGWLGVGPGAGDRSRPTRVILPEPAPP